MAIRFLLGPAGSGKTHRCLAEIRDELLAAPQGANLVFLAPKQATFQLERLLLEDERLAGWSRLQILSFDRLARQILESTRPVELLAEEGRLMVLRALLRRLGPRLRVFHATARLTGFARELSTTLRELQNHHLGPDRLLAIAGRLADAPPLAHKLHDLALLLRAYHDWLREHSVEDADTLPDLATEALLAGTAAFRIDGLWLDGFAEMTPQELALLAAVTRHSRRTTLAFCLDHLPSEDAPWLSTWSVVSQTFRRCHAQLAALPGPAPQIELLPEPGVPSRFSPGRPALAHLARAWTRPGAAPPDAAEDAAGALRLAPCRDPESEAEVAAREIWRHVRGGGRFREIGVLVRALEPVQATLERVFLRYEIPFFLDRRESLAHHPLAELTRAALRLAAQDWSGEDWFGALKTGLAGMDPPRVDSLENLALARGWEHTFWHQLGHGPDPLPDLPGFAASLQPVVLPFARFIDRLGTSPAALELAEALRRLWEELEIRTTLEHWSADPTDRDGRPSALHRSAWEQLQLWLENLERGFGEERLTLAEWLPVLEAGLGSLTAGVIPSAQDQVLVGAIDRSRQPELRLVLLLGVNEGRFPSPPADGGMLTEIDRGRLATAGVTLGPDRRRRVGHERYFGYIAVTRAANRLVLSWSERDEDGRALNPSPFVAHLETLFPGLQRGGDADDPIEVNASGEQLAARVQHPAELLPWLLARSGPTPLESLVGDDLRRAWLRQCRRLPDREPLDPVLVSALFGAEPEVSVSALESLGACPFQFFVRQTLRGRERDLLEADPRRLGSLAHELLAEFHRGVRATGRQWRDVTPDAAVTLLDEAAARLLPTFANGACAATPEARWRADSLVASLRNLVRQLVAWAPAGDFDPVAAELAFGRDTSLPAWRLPLDGERFLRIRGKVDRVDVARRDDGGAEFILADYKLRRPEINDALIAAGIDLQLAAYALALQDVPGWTGGEPGEVPRAAGLFYIGLRGRPAVPSGRGEAPDPAAARAALHVHRGRFRAGALERLDHGARTTPSGQFAFTINRDGSLRKGGDGRADADFAALLASAEEALGRLGRQIHEGDVTPAPYARGRQTACDRCEVREICRFDAWTRTFRRVS